MLKKTTVLALLMSVLVFVAACADVTQAAEANVPPPAAATMDGDGLEIVPTDVCPICAFDMDGYAGPLTQAEVEGLLLALNDEYHATAVYSQVLADFGQIRPFTSIVRSEEQHAAALIALFDAYQVPVPENLWLGRVSGYADVAQACQVGVEAEVLNGGLYDELNYSTDRTDILEVYASLQRASLEKHLPAFERCASRSR